MCNGLSSVFSRSSVERGNALAMRDDIIQTMDPDQFRLLLRDALTNIHDFLALEKNPLSDLVPRPEPGLRRGENLRQFIWDGIEALRPKTPQPQIESQEWRYYLVLSGRYIEGAGVVEMQKRLALGERQERRLHGRAFSALETLLWDCLSHSTGTQAGESTVRANPVVGTVEAPAADDDLSFPVKFESLHLGIILEETTALFMSRYRARGGDLFVQAPVNLPMVKADRIILRQILLLLLNHILQNWAGGEIYIYARSNNGSVILEILSLIELAKARPDEELRSNRLFSYWLERLSARFMLEPFEDSEAHLTRPESPAQVRYLLELPVANQVKILVVDDHEPAIRIIQRYLSQTNIQAVGLTDPTQILPLARTLHPQAVLLDVMMPAVDGWEILQKLKSDPETQGIPVIICSVWEQPDLAFSLGADGFLKKPISQAELFDALTRSHLLGRPGESPLTGS